MKKIIFTLVLSFISNVFSYSQNYAVEDGKIVKTDVSIAKNYLNELELEDMGRLVNAVLDMAERMANRHIPMTMEDWAKRIDIILQAGGDAVLTDGGVVTAEYAKTFAETEFEKYRLIQDRLFQSDFDKFASEHLLPLDDIKEIEGTKD